MHVHLNESTREGTNLEPGSGVVLEGSRDTDGVVKVETSQYPVMFVFELIMLTKEETPADGGDSKEGKGVAAAHSSFRSIEKETREEKRGSSSGKWTASWQQRGAVLCVRRLSFSLSAPSWHSRRRRLRDRSKWSRATFSAGNM